MEVTYGGGAHRRVPVILVRKMGYLETLLFADRVQFHAKQFASLC